MTQGLRPSQYITTFGSGALVETPMGPHILCSTEDVLRIIHANGINMDEMAIRDIRLQNGLLLGNRIFKIPDGQNWPNFRYPTKKFPTWNLCVQHQEFNVIHKAKDGCPECKSEAARRESRKNKHAIRFLVACPKGHLDEVNWTSVVHPRDSHCNQQYFHWVGAGSSLASIKIVCPACEAKKDLGEIYSYKLKCRGRRPEKSGSDNEKCDSNQAVIVQRGSFQLRLPEVITSLTIPPLVNELHRILQRNEILNVIEIIKTVDSLSEIQFWKTLKDQESKKKISTPILQQLAKYSWTEIKEALNQIESVSAPKNKSEYLQQEHQSLMKVVDTGFPPYPSDNDRRASEPVSFLVEATSIRKEVFGPTKSFVFRVMPLERLRVVIVQVGYRRVEYMEPNSVLSSSRGANPLNPNEFWIPGVEQFGEGVYVDLNPKISKQSNWYPEGQAARKWDATIPPTTGMNELLVWNALSVWWHSLSHRLINAMSIHSGYSSTAIRERIYLSKMDNNEYRGGILLYTTQPGGDGTMGGLTSLVPDFEHIFELALRGIERCSNDPLCEHAEIDKIAKLGAACYSCEMVSETSCEHYNSYLHRGLLLENQP